MRTRLRHLWLALTALPALLFNPRQRALFREMRAFTHTLPAALKAPLPEALRSLTPLSKALRLTEHDVRNLADMAALLDRRSPLGLCLRRSLTRYHFLRQIDMPLVLHFGAKFVDGKPDRDITGHAWLTLDGKTYYEDGENWQGFVVMLSFPSENGKI